MGTNKNLDIISFIEFTRGVPLSESQLRKISPQLGSNEGGVHIDSSGQKHYVKHYKNEDQGKVEALAGRIHNHMGIHTTNAEHKTVNGKPAVTSKYNEHLKHMAPKEFESLDKRQAHQVGRMYHAAVLTKNWDVVGSHENIVKNHKTGDLHSIDHGGAFHFRARGGHKDYDSNIGEHKTLRHNDGASGHVFSQTFKQHPDAEHEGLKAVKNLDDKKIHDEFKNSGLHNWKDLHSNFQERKRKLLAQYEGKK